MKVADSEKEEGERERREKGEGREEGIKEVCREEGNENTTRKGCV